MSQRISPNHLIVCFFLLYKNPRLRVAIDNALSQTPEQFRNTVFGIRKNILSILQIKTAYDIMPIGKERNKYLIQAKAPGTAIPRAFFVCFYGTRTEASCCYLFLSNHLQI